MPLERSAWIAVVILSMKLNSVRLRVAHYMSSVLVKILIPNKGVIQKRYGKQEMLTNHSVFSENPINYQRIICKTMSLGIMSPKTYFE